MLTSTVSRMRPIRTIEDYYNLVMDQYAEAGEGLLCRFVPGCPGGDFAHTPYTWTKPQQLAWKLDRRPPCHINDLPGNPNMMLQSLHIPAEKDRIRSRSSTIVNVSINDTACIDTKDLPTTDIRISKSTFLRLEQITSPGIRIWLTESNPHHFLAIPSPIFTFTDDEKRKYRENKFKEDGSDLPTVEGLVRRYQTSGMGKVQGLQSSDNGADVMQSFYDHFTKQDAETKKEIAKEKENKSKKEK